MKRQFLIHCCFVITLLGLSLAGASHPVFSFPTIEIQNTQLDTIPPVSNTVKGLPKPPGITTIPVQYAMPGDTFKTLNLADYLSGIDSSRVAWSYRFSHELNGGQTENWNASFSSFDYSMIMVARIKARDTFPDASGHKLAAFHNGALRGVGSALNAGGDWLFYMTIYGNQPLDSISFKYFHEDQSTIFAVADTVLFIADQIIGHVDNPKIMNAGYLILEQTEAVIQPTVIDKEWLVGEDTIYVMAREPGVVKGFADTTMIIFRLGEEPSLPVELISFTGEAIQSTASLEWRIAQPENVLGYEVHRGNRSPISGILEWNIIGFEFHDDDKFVYTFLDEQADFGKNYYKLRMVDLDASFEWSPIINLTFEPNYQVQFFPNPAIGKTLFLDLVTEVPALVDVVIYDELGRVLIKLRAGTDGLRQRLAIDISDFAGGLYFATVKIGERVLSRSFMVGKE